MKNYKIYDYDPYLFLDEWRNVVYNKLGYNINELVNDNGEALMVVDDVVQDCSLFMFFTELLSRCGVYDEDGNIIMNVADATKVIHSRVAMDDVSAMFKEYNIKLVNKKEDDGEILAKDFIKENDERISNDLDMAKYLEVIYGGDRTINELIAYLSEYVNRNK